MKTIPRSGYYGHFCDFSGYSCAHTPLRRDEEMIFEKFREVANQHWNQPAIIDNEEVFTFGRLLEEVGRHRAWLETALDPRPGDVIAATVPNGWQFAATFLALCELRVVLMPCNPQWRAAELRQLHARIGFRAVICERQFRGEWENTGAIAEQRVLAIEDALKCAAASSATIQASASAEDPVLYMATSGTTGTPRIVPLRHRNLLASIGNSARAMGIEAGDRFLSVVPFHHLHGFNNCMLMPLLKGASLVMMRRFVPEEYAELAARDSVNVLMGSPLIFSHLLDGVSDASLLGNVRLSVSAGARLPTALWQNWKQRFGVALFPWYGTTETSGISIAKAPRQPSSELGGDFVGVRLPSVEVRCLDPEGNDLGLGRLGDVAVRSAAMMSGYLGEPDLNRRVFQDGFFRTGDLGYLEADGGIFLTGRIGRLINMGGVKIDPVEVERAVEALPGVSAVHVDAVPGGRGGEVIRARVVVRPGLRLTRVDVIKQCRRMLGEYKLPRVIEFVDSLPAALTGKTPRSEP